MTRRLPEAGELWVGRCGIVTGRVIRIEAVDDSHVTYAVVSSAPGIRPARLSGRMTAGSLRTTYKPVEAES